MFSSRLSRKGVRTARSGCNASLSPSNPEVLDECELGAPVKAKLLADIQRRMMPQAVKIRSDFDISCFTFEGIDAIKFALQTGLDLSSKELEIKINLIQSPQFMMTCQTLDKQAGLDMLNEAIRVMKEAIESKGGSFRLLEQVRAWRYRLIAYRFICRSLSLSIDCWLRQTMILFVDRCQFDWSRNIINYFVIANLRIDYI